MEILTRNAHATMIYLLKDHLLQLQNHSHTEMTICHYYVNNIKD